MPGRPSKPGWESRERFGATASQRAALACDAGMEDVRALPGRPSKRVAKPVSASALRRLNAPNPALVETHVDGSPRSVNRQQVALVREEWRVVDRWWTEEPVDRRYFDVVLASGENAVVYLDREAQSWFSQRA